MQHAKQVGAGGNLGMDAPPALGGLTATFKLWGRRAEWALGPSLAGLTCESISRHSGRVGECLNALRPTVYNAARLSQDNVFGRAACSLAGALVCVTILCGGCSCGHPLRRLKVARPVPVRLDSAQQIEALLDASSALDAAAP